MDPKLVSLVSYHNFLLNTYEANVGTRGFTGKEAVFPPVTRYLSTETKTVDDDDTTSDI
jgi:hypothetical protein